MREALLLVSILVFSGCCGVAPYEEPTFAPAEGPFVSANVSEETPEPSQEPVPGADGTIIEAPPGPGGEEPSEYPASVATDQTDCSTMAHNCEACLAKQGCNWCKTTNACYYEGIVPTISSCHPNDWAKTVGECAGIVGGKDCSDVTNCADCLSGEGCQWCIQGSVCAPESTTDGCLGGWLTESYQCAAYGSR
jgi:hypothetical protein